MTTITGPSDVQRRRLEDDSERTNSRPSTPPRGTEAIPEYRDATFYAGLVTAALVTEATRARDTAVQQRMDAVRDAYSGPYTVDGQQVTARPMFRMNGGATHPNAPAHAHELASIAAKAGCATDAARAKVGCASPRELSRVTQALLDAGKLPSGPGSIETRIRAMQWEWGIGVDCARYSREAIVAATGASERALQLDPIGTEGFRHIDDKRQAFAKIDVRDCRAGDFITLDPKPPETAGHNVVVYSNETLRRDQEAALANKDPKVADFFRSPGPFRRIKVDSSWGAGANGADYGGFRRETWLLDESTKRWGFVDRETNTFVVSRDGPSVWDRFHGAYRPKVGA